MRTVMFFDAATGLFNGVRFTFACHGNQASAVISANTPAGHEPMVGEFDHLSQRIDVERLAADRAAARAQHQAPIEEVRETPADVAVDTDRLAADRDAAVARYQAAVDGARKSRIPDLAQHAEIERLAADRDAAEARYEAAVEWEGRRTLRATPAMAGPTYVPPFVFSAGPQHGRPGPGALPSHRGSADRGATGRPARPHPGAGPEPCRRRGAEGAAGDRG